ncbi:hypothetical protein LPB072_19310 [Hydrogenophaga crassostreae]|nr:hypothetical protein LPB072_19310 [Hydrogenophaga crassostreae]
MLAVVMSALAPTLAHAWVAAADDGLLIEVCSASGMVWLKADGLDATASQSSDQDQDMPMADMGKHCPWSGVHAPMAGLLPAPVAGVFAPVDGYFQAAGTVVGLPGQIQRGARARAPPLTS